MLSRRLQVLQSTIERFLRKNAHVRLRRLVNRAHPADLAVVFRFLDEDEQDRLFMMRDNLEERADLLSHLDDTIAARIAEDLSVDELASLIGEMDPDDAADLLDNLSDERKERILPLLESEDREGIHEILKYAEDSAGGIMTTDIVTVHEESSVDEVVKTVQGLGDEMEMVIYLYAVTEEERLSGVVSLREVVQAPKGTMIRDLMEQDVIKAGADQDQEEVAKMIARYDLLAVPVVDEENRPLGIVTVDDVIDVIREEATEDMLKMSGTDGELLEDYSLWRNIRSRLPWLAASLIGGVLVMKMIGHFEASLEKVLPLAAFIPVVIGMAGNIGTQSATIIVRGLATGRINSTKWVRTVTTEGMTGFFLGAFYGVLLGAVAWYQYGTVSFIGLVVGSALCAAMLLAAAVGAVVPLMFDRLHVDPALATGPFVTTSVDVMGIFVYFTIATMLIPGLR